MISSQAGSIGGPKGTGEFWERERFSLQSSYRHKNIPIHVANTDKNYGLRYVIQIKKRPKLINQSVCNKYRSLCVYLELNRFGTR